VADWDPRKHPRDLDNGQFTESWATAISDQIAGAVGKTASSPSLSRLQPGGGLPADTPLDGRVDGIADLKAATSSLDDGDGYGRFNGVEFYNPDESQWVTADEARLLRTTQVGPGGTLREVGDTITVDNQEGLTIGLVYDEAVTWQGNVRWRHTDLREIADQTQPPNPDWEYEAEGMWIPGSEIDQVDGQYVFEGEALSYEDVPIGRPIVRPPEMEGLHTHPQKTTVGARLLDNLAAWTGGGYQIYNPDTGTWHTIEEIYQDNPDEEEIELIADGYHLPHLDTSDEIIVRPIPVGD